MTSVYNVSQPGLEKSRSAARFFKRGFKFSKRDEVIERSPSRAHFTVGAKTPTSSYGAQLGLNLKTHHHEGHTVTYHYPSSSRSSSDSVGVTHAEFWSPPTYSSPITISLPIPKHSRKDRGDGKPKPKRPVLGVSCKPLPDPSHVWFDLPSTASAPPPTLVSSHVLSPDARIRKMAKLTRTLGENVPPELVFPPPTRANNHSMRASRSRPNRRRSVNVDATVAVAGFNTVPFPTNTSVRRTAQPESTAVIVPQSPPPFTNTFPLSSRPSRSGDTDREIETWRRKEREWSGEWNLQDYEHVVSGLRGLKAK